MLSSHPRVLKGLGPTGLLLLCLVQPSCSGDATGPGKATIGAEGGTASLAKGAVTLLIPSGALATEVEFSATQAASAPESHLLVPGSTWEIGPAGTTFTKPVTVTLSYDPGSLPEGVRETELGLHQAFGINWQLGQNPTVDTDAHTVSGRVMSLGTFGGQIQAQDGGGPKCVFFPPGNPDLSIPDTQEYRDADLNGDGQICGLTIGSG